MLSSFWYLYQVFKKTDVYSEHNFPFLFVLLVEYLENLRKLIQNLCHIFPRTLSVWLSRAEQHFMQNLLAYTISDYRVEIRSYRASWSYPAALQPQVSLSHSLAGKPIYTLSLLAPIHCPASHNKLSSINQESFSYPSSAQHFTSVTTNKAHHPSLPQGL